MVQPGKNPFPDEPQDHDASAQADTGLEGVVEELKNVLSGLGNETEAKSAPAPVVEPPAKTESQFPFSNGNTHELPEDTPPPPDTERGLLQETPPPSDAEFWNGNVLGWSNKEEEAAAPVEPILESVREPEPEPEPLPPAPAPRRPSPEELLPPLPPSPFDVVEPAPAPVQESQSVSSPFVQHQHEEPAASYIQPPAPPPVNLEIPVALAPPIEEDVPDLEAEKPEGLIQIACIYPKGSEKAGQQFVTTLRGACEKARFPISVQAVYIQPWTPGVVNVAAWAKAAHLAGADRLYVLAAKKDLDPFKNTAADSAAAGVPGRVIQIEHVGLRTLYADILVELRRPK